MPMVPMRRLINCTPCCGTGMLVGHTPSLDYIDGTLTFLTAPVTLLRGQPGCYCPVRPAVDAVTAQANIKRMKSSHVGLL